MNGIAEKILKKTIEKPKYISCHKPDHMERISLYYNYKKLLKNP